LRGLTFHATGYASLRQIARNRFHQISGQKLPQFHVAVPGEEMPQIFAYATVNDIALQ
jgi:hypothetical protein